MQLYAFDIDYLSASHLVLLSQTYCLAFLCGKPLKVQLSAFMCGKLFSLKIYVYKLYIEPKAGKCIILK